VDGDGDVRDFIVDVNSGSRLLTANQPGGFKWVRRRRQSL
jgi:hypothetical protein